MMQLDQGSEAICYVLAASPCGLKAVSPQVVGCQSVNIQPIFLFLVV